MLAKNLTVSGAAARLYSDDVFQAYTRTGTGADVTVTTNIDMTQGYMLWSKGRSGATDHAIYDSLRGVTKDLVSNSAAAETTQSTGLKSVTSTSHTVGSLAKMNTSSATYVDFVFRKAAKFFDVVTYTGNGASSRAIAHLLGQEVGMVMTKATSTAGDWNTYHRSATGDLVLNSTAAQAGSKALVNSATTSTFTVSGAANTNAVTYVAYLFAHDTGADGLIQCGSFTTDGLGNASVNLGWEPQFVFVQCSSSSGLNNLIVDSARGFNMSATVRLDPVQSGAEYAGAVFVPTATGFNVVGYTSSKTFIYLAIRRPNKPPTVGTQVYNGVGITGNGAANRVITGYGFPPDFTILSGRTVSVYHSATDRLQGAGYHLETSNTSASAANAGYGVASYSMDGFTLGASDASGFNSSADTFIFHGFKRAPKVFDVVCYTGTGVAKTEAHGLGVVPELIIVKKRSAAGTNWGVYAGDPTGGLYLNATDAFVAGAGSFWNDTAPTTSVFTVGNSGIMNASAATYVAYLFATKAGISKVGSYTGNATTNTIDCGFTTGARFVLIKRTDSTGDWYVWDTVRGIIAGNDPYLLLNSTAAEVTSTDYIDPSTAGFELSSTAPAAINANGGTFIYLAFA